MTGPVWLPVALALRDDLTELLPDATVTFGPPGQMNSGDYLAVGLSDPSNLANGPHSAATYDVEWDDSITGYGFAEEGRISLGLWAWRATDDIEGAAGAVHAMEAVIFAYLQTATAPTGSLGALGVWDARPSAGAVEFNLEDAAAAFCVVTITYRARINGEDQS